MPILKTKWRRSIAVLLCVMLMFCAAFSLTAYADSAVITTGTMYSYFQTYNTSGAWVDLQTPGHATSDGQVAYCLQTSKDNPYNAAYSSIDGEYVYDEYVLTGLKAILTHGYPADNGGFSDLEARYATANAIRFFLAENYADGMPQYLNLNVNGDWIRGRPGYEDLFYWSLSLLQMARSGNVSTGGAGSLTFSQSEITLTQEGDYFTGSVTLTNGINGTYDLMDDMPEGKQILGHTGADQETLTIKIPVAYANGSYTLCAYGMDHLPTAKLFFWAPSVYNQQRIVTSTLDGSQDVFVRGFLTVKTPSATVQPHKGSLQITKTDDSGTPLSGVGFTLYDSSKRTISTKTTDGSGIVTFTDLTPGNYYYAETSALPGYVPDTTQYAVSITTSSLFVEKTVTNERIPSKGSLKIVKTDETGTPIASTGFQLLDSDGSRIASGGTDSSGVLVFSDLPLGNYFYQETFAVPGYALDDTKYPISITENGQVTIVNYKSAGTIKILKTDSETGQPLQGAEFTILDEHMREVTKGTTDESGVVVFAGLPLGPYYCQESQVPPGYFPEGGIELVYLDGNGKVVTLNYTNKPARGSIKLTKKNSDGELMSGVVFTLYDADKNEIKTGTTDANGVVIFDNLPIGDYWYAETSELPGYVPNHNLMAARVGFHTAVDEHTFTNYKARGHIQVIKSDENGTPLAGVHFKLTDEAGNLINEGDTGTDGKLLFTMLPVGKYILKETATLTGYVLDETPFSIELVNDGDVVTKEITNSQQTGSIATLKTDAETNKPLAGAHFKLTDSTGKLIKEGDTAADGKLIFTGLPLGTYKLTETAAPAGYVLDSTPITVEVTNAGQTVSKTITNTRAVGNISILKTDAETNKPLAGVHFKLTDSTGKLISEAVTGTEGKITFSGMSLGAYTLTETEAPEGYALDSIPIPVELTEHGKTVEISVKNTPSRGNLKLIKKDAYENKPLDGAVYRLLDESGKKLAEGTADENGEIVFENLLYGNYRVQEISAPKGYKVDERAYTVTVPTENGTQTVTDLRRPGTLEVRKQDEKGKPLAGAAFLLEYSTNNGTTWTPVTSRSGENVTAGGCTSAALNAGQLTTDSTGSVSFTGLRADSTILYRLTETKAPAGYSLIGTELYKGTLPIETQKTNIEDSETVDGKTYCYSLYVTATDDPTYRLPETGGRGFDLLPLFMPICAIPLIIYLKRKEECES